MSAIESCLFDLVRLKAATPALSKRDLVDAATKARAELDKNITDGTADTIKTALVDLMNGAAGDDAMGDPSPSTLNRLQTVLTLGGLTDRHEEDGNFAEMASRSMNVTPHYVLVRAVLAPPTLLALSPHVSTLRLFLASALLACCPRTSNLCPLSSRLCSPPSLRLNSHR